MVLSLATKLDGWFVVSPNNLVWIMVILSAQWLNLQLFASCIVLQSEILSLFINWMRRTPSFMVILMNMCIVSSRLFCWFNTPGLCLPPLQVFVWVEAGSVRMALAIHQLFAHNWLSVLQVRFIFVYFQIRYIDDISFTLCWWYYIDCIVANFSYKDLGPLYHFIGISVSGSATGLHLCQCQYALDLLDHDGMTSCHPIATPINTKSKLTLSNLGWTVFQSNALPKYCRCLAVRGRHVSKYIMCCPTSLYLYAWSMWTTFLVSQTYSSVRQRDTSSWTATLFFVS